MKAAFPQRQRLCGVRHKAFVVSVFVFRKARLDAGRRKKMTFCEANNLKPR